MKPIILSIFLLFFAAAHAQEKPRLLPVKINKKWGYIDRNGQVAIPAQFEQADDFQGRFAIVRMNRHYTAIDPRGSMIAPAIYDEVEILNDTLIAVMKDTLWGVVSEKGNVVVPVQCTSISKLTKQLYVFSTNGKQGVITASGKPVVPANYDSIFIASRTLLFAKDSSKLALYGTNGTLLLDAKNDTIKIEHDSLVFFKKDGKWGCTSSRGKMISEAKWEEYNLFRKDIVMVRDTAWELLSLKEGKIICRNSYDNFLSYSPQFIITQSGNTYGLIDINGNELFKPAFSNIDYLSDETMMISKDGLYGLATTAGKITCSPRYGWIGEFSSNIARTGIGRSLGAVSIHGEELVKAENDSLWINGNVIKAFKTKRSEAHIVTVDDAGYLYDDNTYANLKTIRVGFGYNPTGFITGANVNPKADSLRMNDLQWFYSINKRKWGLKNFKTQDTIIQPVFASITVLRNIGMTLVQKNTVASQNIYSYGYGLVNNDNGSFVLKPLYQELHLADTAGRHRDFIRCYNQFGQYGVVSLDGKEEFAIASFIGDLKNGHARVNIEGIPVYTGSKDPERIIMNDSTYTSFELSWKSLNSAEGRNFDNVKMKGGKWFVVSSYGDIHTYWEKKDSFITYDFIQNIYKEKMIVKRDNKWGVINVSNQKVIDIAYDMVDELPGSDHRFYRVVKNSLRYGYIDKYGNEVLEASIDEGRNFHNGMAAVKIKGKWGFINTDGQLAVKADYEDVKDFYDDMAAVRVKGKWGFVNKNGRMVIDPAYQLTGHYNEGLVWVKVKGKCGYIDAGGNAVTELIYTKCSEFHNGLAVVRDGDFGVINTAGLWVVKPKYKSISDYDENGFAIARKRSGFGIISMQGIAKGKFDLDQLKSFSEGMAVARKDGKLGYIDTTGKFVIAPKFTSAESFREGIASVREKNRFGYIDTGGNFIIEPAFKKASVYNEGLAYVVRDNKAGFIDRSGTFAITTGKPVVSSFRNGRAILQDTLRGFIYIDKQGRPVCSKRFEKAFIFTDSVACVKYSGKWGVIDATGMNVTSFKYDDMSGFSEGIAKFRITSFTGVMDAAGKEAIPVECNNVVYYGDNLFKIERSDKVGYFSLSDGKWMWVLSR